MSNRPLKFRIWDKQLEKFMDEKNCFLLFVGNTDKYLAFNTKFGLYPIPDTGQKDLGWDKYVIQQFTGLKDKNNKEIYDGDIVKFTLTTEQIGDVRWNGRYYVIYVKLLGPTPEFYPAPEVSEIVGNIFENPELLK